MADLRDIFAAVGIVPGATMAPSTSEFLGRSPVAFDAYVGSLQKQQNQLESAAGPGFNQEVGFAYETPTAVAKRKLKQAEEDSYGWGDLLHDTLAVLDTGRAYVASGVKELTDTIYGSRVGEWLSDAPLIGETPEERAANLERMGTGSWNDFLQQGKDHMDFRDVVEATSPDSPEWVKTTVGLAGDIALDPLTYIPVLGQTRAAGKAAVTAADEALIAAVRHGGRKEIAEALAVKAAEAGLHGDEAIGRLVKDAAQRGRGAFTRGALERAGLDAAKVEAMNLPGLERAFLGMSIPKSRILADSIEATKGAFKKTLGETAAAEYYRALRITELNGRRAMTNILRGSERDLNKVWAAVTVLGLDSQANRVSRGWGTRTAAKMMKELSDTVGKISDDAAVTLTHGIESGTVVNGMEAFTNMYATVANEMVDRGLMTADQIIPNYVPHYTTNEALAFAKGTSAEAKEVKNFLRKVSDSAGFLEERGLTAGDTFLGETLQTGSIQEINEISSRHGFKMFEDDIRTISARYLATAQNEIGRDVIRKGLIDAGIATDKGIVRHLSEEELAKLAAAKDAAKSVRRKIDDLRGKSFTTRKNALVRGRKAIIAEKKQIASTINALEAEIRNVGKQRVRLVAKVAKAEEKIAAYQGTVDLLQRQLDNFDFATEAKLAAQVDLKKASAQLAKAQAEHTAARDELENFLKQHTAPVRPSGKKAATQVKYKRPIREQKLAEGLPAREANLAELKDALEAARKRYSDIESDIGMYDFELDRIGVSRPKAVKALEKPKQLLDDAVNAKSADMAEIAQIDSLVLSNEDAIGALDAVMKQLEDRLATHAPYKGRQATYEAIAELKQRGQELSDFLRSRGSGYWWKQADGTYTRPMVEAADAMARDEALAWIYDAKQIILGRKQDALEDLIRTMNDPNFGSLIEYKLHSGMASLNETKQIPQWLDQALQIQVKISDPKFLPGFQKFMEGFNQRWKIWALARPGAVARNAMGSGMNVYLDRGIGALGSVNDFMKFHVMFKKNPEGYLDDALEVWSKEEVDMMDRAMSIVSGSGGGQSLVETERNLLNPGNWNPLSKDFKPLHWSGKANEEVETILRGGHAYDVLKSGGSDNLALDTVEKWHFNYRDITNFDRTMKKVFPFWTFFSRNTALQAHVWTHNFNRLAKFMKIKRSLEGGENDPLAPDWVVNSNAIGLDINPEGTSTYMDLGLPSFDFYKNVQDPAKVLGNVNPLLKLPVEGFFNRNLSTGGNFNNVKPAGNVYGFFGHIPGVSALFEDTGSGGKALTPFKLQVLNNLLPGLANASRMGGGQPKAAWPAWVSWFTGISFSELTPEQRAATLRAEERAQSAAEYKQKILENM